MSDKRFKITAPETGGFYITKELTDIGVLQEIIDLFEEGETPLQIEIIELKESDYEKMSEFNGF